MQKTDENSHFLHTFSQNTAKIQSSNSPDYPYLLKHIDNPPQSLYYMGDLGAVSAGFNLAVVGSRKMTGYGRLAAEFIISGFQGMPITVVSGLALGTDAWAHECALKAGLKTVAVLGSGLDRETMYPRANRGLAEKILSAGGLMLSEYPDGAPALKQNFPARNRIISGISRAVLIIEADYKSGALITAKHAWEQNREIYAVPGNINSKLSQGANNCIFINKAMLARSAEDIITQYEELTAAAKKARKTGKPGGFSPLQKKIIAAISENSAGGSADFDEILAACKINPERLNAEISMLILSGAISVSENGRYGPSLTKH